MKKIILFSLIVIIASFLVVNVSLAQGSRQDVINLVNPIGGTDEQPTGQTNLLAILGQIINWGMGIVGSITLFVFIVGGFLWLTSAGNDERVKMGTDTMTWAAIGLFLIFSSYAIMNLVLDSVGAKKETTVQGLQLTPLEVQTGSVTPAVATTPATAPSSAPAPAPATP